MTENEKYNIEDFWPGAEELLDQHFQKRSAWLRNRRWILIGLALIVIGGFTALWFNVSSSGKVEAIKSNQISETLNIKTDSLKNDYTNSTKENSNALENNSELKNDSESITSPIKNDVNIQGKSNEVEVKSNLIQTKQNLINKTTTQQTIMNSSEGQKSIKTNDTKASSNFKTNEPNEDVTLNPNKAKENTIVNESLGLNTEKEFIPKNVAGLELNALTRLNPIPASIQPKISIPLTLNNNLTNDLLNVFLLKDSDKNKRKSGQFFVKLGAGVNYVDKTISSANYPDYVSRREKEESGALYSSFNLHVGWSKNRLRLSTGVELNQYGENIKYNNWLLGEIEEINSSITYITDSTLNTVTYYI